jgi:phosphoribosylanthranilate isomerase
MNRVKVCGLTNPDNAKEVAEAGADFTGFIFHPSSKRYVGMDPNPDLFRNIPGHVKKVGVFVNEVRSKVIDAVIRHRLNLVQLHGSESADYCHAIRTAGVPVIKAFGIGEDFSFDILKDFKSACDFFLFDTQTVLYGGSGVKFRWERLKEYDMDVPFFIGGGIGPQDAVKVRAIDHPALYATDINSRFEVSPGVKDVHLVRSFIEEIKNN